MKTVPVPISDRPSGGERRRCHDSFSVLSNASNENLLVTLVPFSCSATCQVQQPYPQTSLLIKFPLCLDSFFFLFFISRFALLLLKHQQPLRSGEERASPHLFPPTSPELLLY